MKNRVVIFACYFGTLPQWIELWLKSCEYNPQIDFILMTDATMNCAVPANVKIVKETFANVKNRIQTKYVNAQIENPYKLCDIKPMYGDIFGDLFEEYNFWGHCDLDMIFGDLTKEITDENLDKADRLGRYGHLILYRNNAGMNRLYKKHGGIYPFEKVISSKENMGFDEMTGMNRIAEREHIRWYKDFHIANMSTMFERFRLSYGESRQELFCWEKGKVFRYFLEEDTVLKEEFLYIHFSGKKPKYQQMCEDRDRYILMSEEIIPMQGKKIDKDDIIKYNRYVDEQSDQVEIKKGKRRKVQNVLKKNWRQKKIWFRMQIALKIERLRHR